MCQRRRARWFHVQGELPFLKAPLRTFTCLCFGNSCRTEISLIRTASWLTSCRCATRVKDLGFVYRSRRCSAGPGLVQPIKANEHLLGLWLQLLKHPPCACLFYFYLIVQTEQSNM